MAIKLYLLILAFGLASFVKFEMNFFYYGFSFEAVSKSNESILSTFVLLSI